MIGKLQRSTVSKSQGTNMINKLGWITNTKSGQRSNPFLKSKNLNEEGCLQWRCTLWKPLSGQPLEKKILWIIANDFSDCPAPSIFWAKIGYFGLLGSICNWVILIKTGQVYALDLRFDTFIIKKKSISNYGLCQP